MFIEGGCGEEERASLSFDELVGQARSLPNLQWWWQLATLEVAQDIKTARSLRYAAR